MSTKKKGLITCAGEWAKHLRPFGKQRFWSRERGAAKREITNETKRDSQRPKDAKISDPYNYR